MDQKKLLQIIQKDLSELNELTEELIGRDTISMIEIEIALSKSKLVMQEFELLKERSLYVSSQIKTKKNEVTAEVIEKPQERKEEIENETPEHIIPQAEQEIEIDNTSPSEQIQANEEEALANELESAPIKETENISKEEPTDEKVQELIEEKTDDMNNELDQEEDTIDGDDSAKVVGERFAKEKSLNDMMSDSKTLDQQFATSSIQKIENAIGLNERFQYIRELFNGDADLFKSTVQELDQMSDIKQAVNHLSINFKWKKNETSLKFVQLVKRRFLS